MTTQSCKIEMLPLIQLIGNRHSPHDLSKSRAFTMQQGFRNKLIIGDGEGRHRENMYRVINSTPRGNGIPSGNIVLFGYFNHPQPIGNDGNMGLRLLVSGDYEPLRRSTKVVHLPLASPLDGPQDAPRVRTSNTLFVLAAGNVASHAIIRIFSGKLRIQYHVWSCSWRNR